ncbi:MAG: C-terminal binding protein, partial [SAR202 cluster bacterium]|nr:C-terminal binding protein [SAR202 cluster bacterium]
MAAKGKVLVTDYVWPSLDLECDMLTKAGLELVAAPDGNEQTLVSLAKDAVGILTCFAKVTGKVLESAKDLKVVGRYGVGVDNIDVPTATRLGIAVTYVPDYCVDEVSDHAIAMMLAWNRRIVLFDTATKGKGWGSVKLNMPIMRLRGKKLGVVGFGRIGRASAAKGAAFGMEVLAYDPVVPAVQIAKQGARPVDLATLLKESDFVTLHVPLSPQTRGLVSTQQFAAMKPTAVIINTARGPLIDEAALLEALRQKRIAGAALDVLESDHPPKDHPFMSMDNVLITPHVAFYSREAMLELEERATGEVIRVLKGQMPQNLYNRDVLSHVR